MLTGLGVGLLLLLWLWPLLLLLLLWLWAMARTQAARVARVKSIARAVRYRCRWYEYV